MLNIHIFGTRKARLNIYMQSTVQFSYSYLSGALGLKENHFHKPLHAGIDKEVTRTLF